MLRSTSVSGADDDELTFDPGRSIAGRYRLIELVGDGSMGSVWKAEHLALGTAVAIKLLHKSAHGVSAETERRFALEARAAAALRGPHVVQIMDHGVDGGVPYIVLELLDGESLEAHLGWRRRMPLREVSRLVTHVARALTKAREVGYVHRDLKPSNIFLSRTPGSARSSDWTAKVLDFGLAKSNGERGRERGRTEHSALTEIGKIVGTPKYMSPEQVRGLDVDHRSDLWSLALIAYECAAGLPAFDGETLEDLMLAICEGAPRPPSSVHGSLPPAFDAWFAQAVAKSPSARFQSAEALADALAKIDPRQALEPIMRPPRPAAARVGAQLGIGLDSTVMADALVAPRGDTVAIDEGATVSAAEAELEEATVDSTSFARARMSIPMGELGNLYQSPLDLEELTTFWEDQSHTAPISRPAPTLKLGDRVMLRYGDAQVGPVQMLEVLQALRDGHVSPQSLARQEHAATWQPLEELRVVDDAGRALDLRDLRKSERPPPMASPAAPAPPIVAAAPASPAPPREPDGASAPSPPGPSLAHAALGATLAVALAIVAYLLAR